MSINRVTLTGNLTRDSVLRSTTSGLACLSFAIAVNDRVRHPKTGEWEERPNFIEVTLFGKRGEHLVNILKSGFKVGIDGRLRWQSWEKDGIPRSKVDVVAESIELLTRIEQ